MRPFASESGRSEGGKNGSSSAVGALRSGTPAIPQRVKWPGFDKLTLLVIVSRTRARPFRSGCWVPNTSLSASARPRWFASTRRWRFGHAFSLSRWTLAGFACDADNGTVILRLPLDVEVSAKGIQTCDPSSQV